MKRLISSLLVTLSLMFVSAGTVLAEHYWQLDMFQPTSAITGNTFNIEYKAMSLEKEDDFTVNLYQNNAAIGTQNTTKDYGDSGVFTVTVPGPGSYQYHVTAQSSVDGSIKATEDRTLTVTTTPSGTTSTVFVNQANAAGGAGGAQGGGGFGAGAAGVAAGQNAAGEVAGAAAAAGNTGQVGADGESTDNNGEILGAEQKNQDKADSGSGNWAWWLIPAVAILGGAAYYYIQRTGNNPFKRNTSE